MKSYSRNSYSRRASSREANAVEANDTRSRNAYSRDVASVGYARERRKDRNRKRLLLGVAAVLLVVLGVGSAFAVSYMNKIEGNINAGVTEDALSVLDPVQEGDPFYILLMGVDGSEARANSEAYAGDNFRSDSMILARVDPGEKTATMISLHRDTMIDMGAYGTQKLNAAHAFGGAAYAIQVVSEFAGVPISHYAEINFDGFKAMVDSIGGVEVDVPVTINDSRAGGYLEAGVQTINGDQALILCRSRHTYDGIGDGDRYRAANQRMVLTAIAEKILTSDVGTIASTIETVSQYATTDMSVMDIITLATSMIGMDTENGIYTAMEPTTAALVDGVWYEYVNEYEWETMMSRVDQGLPPYDESVVDPSTGIIMANSGDDAASIRVGNVSVRNGTETANLCAEPAAAIEAMGYTVDTGDANGADYEETVVVYDNPGDAEHAQEIVDAIGQGKILLNDGDWIFSGKFLVLIGADWKQ